MTEMKLTYRGSIDIEPEEDAPDLLDALLEVHGDDSPLEVEAGQIRPQQKRAIVKMVAEGGMDEINNIKEDLAVSVAELGLEEPEYDSDGEEIVKDAQEVAEEQIRTRVIE